MFRIQINTSFIKNNVLEIKGWAFSPEDCRKDRGGRIDGEFNLKITFEDYCPNC
jgi:hypothetical protein